MFENEQNSEELNKIMGAISDKRTCYLMIMKKLKENWIKI